MKTENNNNWRLLFTPHVDPYMNMAIDDVLTSKCIDSDNGKPTIRFYTWKVPSYSIGYFQNTENSFKILKEKGIPIVRRPTGGGIVYHGNDITFSIIKRKTHNNKSEDITSFYKLIGKSILRGLKKLGFTCTLYIQEKTTNVSGFAKTDPNDYLTRQSFCSVTPAKYDVLIKGNKIAGYAARRSQGTILCQGYLDLSRIISLRDVYENWKDKYNNSRTKTINLLFNNLASSFEKVFRITLTSTQLTEEEKILAHKIRDKKYACKEWNYRK
ncbi:MAG: Octanoyltransferase LipM [Candidatus Scalindua rubra]|uniref:Octanoyltransferase LipM n=1 Tax=Candidatus Scalindua rubra TaxID=1872076 RepID=A0A1E3XFA8_9BACT|nr:MAG: Octanoyltransferase LipM [Candidatus Scalindua rubra]